MNSIKFQNRILPKAKLPFNTIRGNEKQRIAAAGEYWNKFMDEFIKIDEPNSEDLRKCINKTLAPNTVSYKICNEVNDLYNGSCGFDSKLTQISSNKMFIDLISHCINLHFNKNNKILSKLTVAHELRHFFDHLFQPKTSVLRGMSSYTEPIYDEAMEDLRDTLLDPYSIYEEEYFKKDVDEAIEQLPNNVAIDALQSGRYSIKAERRAMLSGIKYLRKIKDYNEAREQYATLVECNYPKREEYVVEKLKELIHKERKLNH